MEQEVFEAMAYAHPHEIYDYDPERFWEYFHRRCPKVPREIMVKILDETEK